LIGCFILSGPVSAGAAERFAEVLIHSLWYPVRVARGLVLTNESAWRFYHSGAHIAMWSLNARPTAN
jgi:hypothetical protein